MSDKNYLIGYGERLTERIDPPRNKVDKNEPYSYDESKVRLLPQIKQVVQQIQQLSDDVCPHGRTVAAMTLHPTYVAKSYYPTSFIQQFGLEAIGSKLNKIDPEKWTIQKPPDEAFSTQIFIAGTKDQFYNMFESINKDNVNEAIISDFIKIENFTFPSATEKIKNLPETGTELALEIVLHASGLSHSDYIVKGFADYVEDKGGKVKLENRLYADGLCFLSVRSPRESIDSIARFSFLRALRGMPKIRPLESILRNSTFNCKLPSLDAVDPSIKVAVLDGGIPDVPAFDQWVQKIDLPGLGDPVPSGLIHGSAVTSALLFGSLDEDSSHRRPYCKVDHYRVLDVDDEHGNDEITILNRIKTILTTRKYDFVNISLGPDEPVEDNDISPWTAVLDEIFSNGDILATLAVGNTGMRDHESGNARIQPPADCVNGLSVGACNTQQTNWQRAEYSSVGPGRSPGIVKPDIVSFGGSMKEPFWYIDPYNPGYAISDCGTSYSAPLTLRTAVGIKATFGNVLTPVALKALVIHTAENNGNERAHIGWGRTLSEVEDCIQTPSTDARVIYQGYLSPSEWVNFPIPVPNYVLNGMVSIKATFCFFTQVDSKDPVNYTRSGVEIRFRPHEDNRKDEDQQNPTTKPFFQAKSLYSPEYFMRSDAHKWETTLSSNKKFRGTSLKNPTFNIHYNARSGGSISNTAMPIPYALVVSISAPKNKTLYNDIVNRYRGVLEILQPKIMLPVQVRI